MAGLASRATCVEFDGQVRFKLVWIRSKVGQQGAGIWSLERSLKKELRRVLMGSQVHRSSDFGRMLGRVG